MPIRINSNQQANNVQRSLNKNQDQLGKTFEKLASGKRINRAADDAAGLAASLSLLNQLQGNNQAIANAEDATNLTQTADGGLDQTTEALQRLRELSIQAANGTYTQSDREAIQAEVDQLVEQLTSNSRQTQFNGRNLLDGSVASSVPAQDASATVANNVRVGNGSQFGDLVASVSPQTPNQTEGASFQIQVLAGATQGQFQIEIQGSDGFYSIYSDASTLQGQTVTLGNAGSQVSVSFAAGAQAPLSDADVGKVATLQLTGQKSSVTADRGLTFQVGANEGQSARLGIGDYSAQGLSLEGLSVLGGSVAQSQVLSQNALGAIDQALSSVNTQRALLGAFQNRLESTVQNLGVAAENQAGSISRIQDVDVARASSDLVRQQILAQVSTALLTQANVSPQSAIQLLS